IFFCLCFFYFFPLFFFFFFFQAEDGIRDRNVTGVQTCALPISLSVYFSPALFIIKKLPDVIQFTLTDFFFSICSQNTVDIHFILSGHSFTGKKAVKQLLLYVW